MILDTTNRSIDIALGEAIATSQFNVLAFFDEVTTTTSTTFTKKAQSSASNGTTNAAVVDAPAINTYRHVRSILFYNADTINHTINVRHRDVFGTSRVMFQGLIAPGFTLTYADGRFSVDNPILKSVGFAVDRNNVDQTGLNAGAANKISFNNKPLDNGSYFDAATNYRFQPSVPGWYKVTLNVKANTGTAGETCQAVLYKNGASYKTGQYMSVTATSTFVSTVNSLLFFNGTTDYIEGYVYLPAAVTTLLGDTKATYMSGFLAVQ